MQSNWKIPYSRTLAFLEFLKLDIQSIKPSFDGTVDMHILLTKFIQDQSQLSTDVLDRLNEICAIENEKLVRANTKEEMATIFELEVGYCKSRDRLLKRSFDKNLKSKFVLSPYVKTYESYWRWTTLASDGLSLNFKAILEQSAGDYFFLFQQTGTDDALTRSNILELPLTEYQYFLLPMFERPSTIDVVIGGFMQEFDCTSAEEELQLKVNTEALIRNFIFKMFIVEAIP